MTTPQTHANANVLAFYKELPFNARDTATHAATVRTTNLLNAYPVLPPLLRRGTALLEVGCGVGTFALNVEWRHGCRVTAIDYNPVAIQQARLTADQLGSTAEFQCADLFLYDPPSPADVVISLGVLHHTNSCKDGLRRCLERFTARGGYCFIGLYHRYGRLAFREHFDTMARRGASESTLFEEYARLHSWVTDRTHLYSWFRDQVLHPHETQHTLDEVANIGAACECDVVATSINHFESISSLSDLFVQERAYEELGRKRLYAGVYFPGFFVTLLRRRP